MADLFSRLFTLGYWIFIFVATLQFFSYIIKQRKNRHDCYAFSNFQLPKMAKLSDIGMTVNALKELKQLLKELGYPNKRWRTSQLLLSLFGILLFILFSYLYFWGSFTFVPFIMGLLLLASYLSFNFADKLMSQRISLLKNYIKEHPNNEFEFNIPIPSKEVDDLRLALHAKNFKKHFMLIVPLLFYPFAHLLNLIK